MIGSTGIIKPSTVSVNDIEILYSYSSDRSTEPSNFILLDANLLIKERFLSDNSVEKIPGMYLLNLPSDIFNEVGFYSLYIRPKQIKTNIVDCGVLSSLPNVKGIVLNIEDFANDTDKILQGGLCGFRVEYLNNDGSLINNKHTIVTWSNRCEAISQNINNTSQKNISYRFTDSGNFLFLTVNPSTNPSVQPSVQPNIGVANQQIILSNTYFDPVLIDIELSEYDIDKIALGIFGEKTLNIETGVENVYTKDREIYKQRTIFDIKDETGNPLYKVAQSNTTIDTSETWDTINENVI